MIFLAISVTKKLDHNKGSLSHEVEIGADPLGNLQRLSNALESMTGKMAEVEQKLANVEHQLETAKVEVTKPFVKEQELSEKLERLSELNALLNMDEKGEDCIGMDGEEPQTGEAKEDSKVEKQPETEGQSKEEVKTEKPFQTGEQAQVPDEKLVDGIVANEPFKPVTNLPMKDGIAGHGEEKKSADGVKGRVSVKEKLAEMSAKIGRDKAYGQKKAENTDIKKNKGKEESL